MIERSHLAILSALNNEGSLALAADSLHLTQSALTHAIRKLEKRFNTSIWEKQGRGVRLTQAGEYLLELSEQLLPQFEAADKALAAFGAGKQGMLRIGMECHPCYEWLMNIVPAFLKEWPKVDLDVIQQFKFNGFEALQNHKIDLLITSDPVEDPSLSHHPVLNYELLLVTAANKTSPQTKFVKAKAFSQEHLITFPVERARLDVFTKFLIPQGIEPKSEQSVETIEIMLQLVASGRGVCTLPDWLVRKYQSLYPIQGLRLGGTGVHKQLFLIHRKSDNKLAYLRDFIIRGKGDNS